MKIIGIDLGTTNTYLYGVGKGDAAPAPVTLPRISDENGCIATVILYQDDKPCLIGNIAESEYHTNRARLASRTLPSQFKPEIAHGGSEAMRWMTDFLHELRAALPGARAFHASCKTLLESGMTFRREGVPMGLPGLDEWHIQQTDADAVRAAKAAVMR